MYLEKERKVIAYLKELFPLKSLIRFGAFLLVTVTVMLYAAPVEVPHVFKFGDVVSSSRINANFKALEDRINSVVESVPVGTIIPYGGHIDDTANSKNNPDKQEVIPGWLLCDGTELDAVASPEYADLYIAIRNNWGGTDNTNFRLPDLRGVFIRGVSGLRNDGFEDPEKTSRISVNGGNTGNLVGAFQPDAFQGHRHKINMSKGAINDGYVYYSRGALSGTGYNDTFDATYDGVNGQPRISSETRSKNAAVCYLIKY